MTEAATTARKCSTCWTALGDTDTICPACGGAVTTEPARPRSVNARRGLLFALLPFAVNVVSNLITRILDPLVLETPTDTALFWVAWIAELGLLGITFAGNAVLIVLAFRFSLLGLRDTRDGVLAGRGSAKAGIVFAVIGSVLFILGLVSQVTQIVIGLTNPIY